MKSLVENQSASAFNIRLIRHAAAIRDVALLMADTIKIIFKYIHDIIDIIHLKYNQLLNY